MAQDNVAIVRASWEAWRRGDVAALFEFYDPDVEFCRDGRAVCVEIYRDEGEALAAIGLRE